MGKKARGKHRLDKYYHLAKEQGYRARSAFKLVQLNRKFGFLNQSRSLLDLCAAPGGWLQVAVKTMPVASQILGVDLVPIRPIRGVKTFVEDITTQKCRQTLKKEMKGGLCDVVIHDGAPNVGGAWSSEAYSQSSLVVDALRLASEFLKPNGVFVTKIFRSKDYHALLYAFQQLFDKVDSTKPSASRHASAEIFTVCRGFKAAAKTDPRLLDPRHLFQDVADTPAVMGPDALLRQQQKKGRHRSGYEDGMSSSHRPASALSFVLSERPVEMLGTVTALVLDGGASQQLPQAAAEHSVADAVRSAALIRDHQSTDREIHTLCSDLQVLGRSEFKQLLKWRMALRKELLETGKPKQDGSGRQASEEAAAGQEADEASKAEAESAALLKEMEEVKARIEARQKRDRRRRRELRKKGKLRSAQLAQQEGIGEEAHPDDEALFTLSAMKSKAALDRVDAVGAAAGDELGSDLASGSEDEAAGAAEDASDGEDDDLRYEALVEEYLDTCYQAYLEKQGRKKQVERKKRKRLGMDDLPEGEDGDAALPVAEPPSDDEDDADGGLIVDLDQAPRPTEAAVAKQWFSQGLFQDANLLDDDDDDEEEGIGRDAKAGVAPRGNGAAAETEGLTRAMQQRQQHRADQHSDSESESLEEEELQPSSRRKGAEADRHGDDAGPRTASPGPPKSATLRMGLDKGSDQALRQQGEASGSESEDEGMPDAQGAAGSGAGRSPLTSKGGFEVVPQEVHSDGSGSTDTEDEFDALNDQGKAEVLALAKRMRLSKEKHSIVEQAYNRFAFHDRHLPRWFAEEESKFMRPAPILSQEEVEEQKAALQAVDTRPIKKVAEAKARKRKRAAAKMVKAKARAEAISSQEDVPMKSRMREIEKVYARARSSGNRGSKGRKGDKRKAPPLDRRMKKDARGLKKAAAKKGGKGKGKKSGGVRKR